MGDSEVVASIVAGDPDGLAAAYDRYADPLYKYCRTLVRDPADAADAVQDTFVIAACRLDGLRDPERLRAWLYAVARNECLRILRAGNVRSVLDQALDMTGDSADVSREAQRADLRALFEDATDGLNSGEREVIELQLRGGLAAAEVADVLGVSRNHAHALMSRAREQLETCLGVLLVSRAGREQCGELAAMLGGWDGRLTVLLRKRLHRHIQRCGTCATTRDYQLRPSALLDLSPGAALAAGAALSSRAAVGAPEGLRGHTLALATGHGPTAAAHAAALLSRAGKFTTAGFPRPAGQDGQAGGAGQHAAGGRNSRLVNRGFRSFARGQAIAAAAVVIAVAVAAAAFALSGNNQPTAARAELKPTVAVIQSASPQPGTTRAPRPPQTATASPRNPARATSKAAPASTTAGSSPASASPPPSPSDSPTPTPTGTLSAFPAGGTQSQPQPLMVVPGSPGTPIYLSASGDPVSWSVSVANDPDGVVSVSPASGALTPGSSATVTVSVSQYLNCDPAQGAGQGGSGGCPTITISPGGAVYTIWTGGRHHSHDASSTPAPAAVPIATLAN